MKKWALLLLFGLTNLAYAQIQSFGIFSPVYGLREDIPSITIPEAFTTDNENVLLRYGEIHRAKLRSDQLLKTGVAVRTPDTNPVIQYHWFEKTDGNDYLLAFTADSIYHWDTVGFAWDRKFLCSASCTTWSVLTFNNKVYATNNIDMVQEWNGSWGTFRNAAEADKYSTGTLTVVNADATVEGAGGMNWDPEIAAGDLIYIGTEDRAYVIASITDDDTLELTVAFAGTGQDTLSYVVDNNVGIKVGTSSYVTAARFVADFEGYLLVGNVLADGSTYATTVYWSDTQDGDTWDSGNASYLGLPGPDPLLGTGKVADFLLVFSGRSIDQMWATDSSLIFNSRRLRNNLGSFSPDSVVNGSNGELYFMDNRNNLREIRSVMSDMLIISYGIDKTVKLIPEALAGGVKSAWVDGLEQIWWSIPYGPQATANSKVICLDTNGTWTRRDLEISAFGEFEEKTTYTWATLPFATWNDWGWEQWWTIEAIANYRLDICGDSSGYTYNSHNSEQDSGDSYTGYAVIGTDLSHGKGTPVADRYKRLVYMTLLFRNENGGTADIYLKRDLEGNFQSLGSVSLAGTTDILWQKLNADYRARYFQLKIAGDNPFRFIGVIFYFTVENQR